MSLLLNLLAPKTDRLSAIFACTALNVDACSCVLNLNVTLILIQLPIDIGRRISEFYIVTSTFLAPKIMFAKKTHLKMNDTPKAHCK